MRDCFLVFIKPFYANLTCLPRFFTFLGGVELEQVKECFWRYRLRTISVCLQWMYLCMLGSKRKNILIAT